MVVPEFPDPRIHVFENARISRTVLRLDGIVEPVEFREVIVEVGEVFDIVERGSATGFGIDLDLGDEAIENAGALAIGKGREFRVGGSVPIEVRGRLESSSFPEGSERNER